MELVFRQITSDTYAVFGITTQRVEEDMWARLDSGISIPFILHVQPFGIQPPAPILEDITPVNQKISTDISQMDVKDILTNVQWETAGGWGTAILRPSPDPRYSFVFGAIKTEKLPWPTETLLSFGKYTTEKKKQPKTRGSQPTQVFTQTVWGDDNIGFGSTFHPEVCKELDMVRIMGLTALKANGREGLEAVFECCESFIAETALGNLKRDGMYRKIAMDMDIKPTFHTTYTQEEAGVFKQNILDAMKKTRIRMKRCTLKTEHNQQGEIIVVIGRWDSIPTGPWAYESNCEQWNTTPIFTKTQVRWYSIVNYKTTINIEKHIFDVKKFPSEKPFASKEDLWSLAYKWASMRSIGTTIDPNNPLNSSYKFAIYKAKRMALGDIQSLIDGVESLKGLTLFSYTLREILKTKKDTKSTTGQIAAQKARATREANKKGGNPRQYEEGDVLVTTYPMHFPTIGTVKKFYYVRGEGDTKPRFYARKNPEGQGVGTTYKPTKKYLRKVCPNAFKECRHFSSHEQMSLLQEQAQNNTSITA